MFQFLPFTLHGHGIFTIAAEISFGPNNTKAEKWNTIEVNYTK